MTIGTAKDVAELLKVRVETVYQMAQAGELPTLRRIGGRFRFDLEQLTPGRPVRQRRRPRKRVPATSSHFTLAQIERLPDAGFVYFIQGVAGGPIKIGKADDVERRIETLQHSCPVKLRLLAVVAGGKRREYGYHRRFRASLLHGEWFEPTPELLAVIASAARSAA